MLTANRSTGERARPTGCGRPSGEGAYAYGSNAAGPRADGVEQESLLAEQRGIGNNLAERRAESAWSEKATGRDSVNATISTRTDFFGRDNLRSKRRIRRSQHSRIFKDSRGQIVDAISIRERPAEIEDRAIPGHWEGDLIGGTKNSHIATLVERHSRFTALVKVRSKDTVAVVPAVSRQIRRLPTSLRRSLTWDRGLEMAKHKTFTVATNVKVYFCDPHSPWQRGTNENTNRLLRQYLPKRTDLSGYTQSQLDKIALRLNQRPLQTLGFQTPASKLRASVAPTS